MAAGDSVQAFYAARELPASRTARTTTRPTATSAGPSSTSSTGRSTGSTPSPRPSAATSRALWIVEEDGSRGALDLRRAVRRGPTRWPTGCASRACARGDRIILMLGNQVELWETMLAAMKLGAVRHPGHHRCCGPADLRDRVERGGARHVVVAASDDAAKFADVAGRLHPDRGRRRARRAGCDYADAAGAPTPPSPRTASPAADDTAAALLHLRHHGAAQARRAHPRVVPGRAPVHDVLDRAASPATSTSTSPRRAGPSTPGATSSRRGTPRRACSSSTTPGSTPRRLLGVLDRCGVTSFCAPPTVWRMLIQADLTRLRDRRREGGRRRRAAQPRGHRAGRAGVGRDDPRRLRPDRDHRADRQLARASRSSRARWAGRCPGYPSCCSTRRRASRPTRARSASTSTDAAAGPDGRLPRRRRAHRRGDGAAGYYHTGDVGARDADGYITYVGRADDVFKASDYRISPVRAGERADRAPGGRRGRGGALAGPAAAGRAEGVRRAGRRATSRRPRPRGRSWSSPATTSRPTSGSAAWSSPSCPRRSRARSAGSSCGAGRWRAPTGQAPLGGVHTVGVPLLARGNRARGSRRRQWTDGCVRARRARGCGTRGTSWGTRTRTALRPSRWPK